MILSFERNFLFLKNPKTAGTSIEIALSRTLNSPKDIVTTISPKDELIRLKEGGLSPQNWANPSNNLIERAKKWKKIINFCRQNYNDLFCNSSNKVSTIKLLTLKRQIFPANYWNHMKLDDVIDRIGLENFERLFSFVVIRHPFNRVISSWLANAKQEEVSRITLSQARTQIKNALDTDGERQKDFCFSEKYRTQVTKIYKFEELDSGLKDACLQIGMKQDVLLPLPKVKTTNRKNSFLSFDKQDIIDEELKELIYFKYQWEFENFYQTESWK